MTRRRLASAALAATVLMLAGCAGTETTSSPNAAERATAAKEAEERAGAAVCDRVKDVVRHGAVLLTGFRLVEEAPEVQAKCDTPTHAEQAVREYHKERTERPAKERYERQWEREHGGEGAEGERHEREEAER
jgi:hypothetical protein